jgi:hypothetical protein
VAGIIVWQIRLPRVPAHGRHHLKVLHEAGLLTRHKRGAWVYYRARPGARAKVE